MACDYKTGGMENIKLNVAPGCGDLGFKKYCSFLVCCFWNEWLLSAKKKKVDSVVFLSYVKFLSLVTCLIVHCFIYFHYSHLYDNFQHALKQKYSLCVIRSSIVFHI